MVDSIRKVILGLKIVAYIGLGFMIYFNLLGPEGVAEFLKIDEPSQKGLKSVEVIIPKYVLNWTFGTVILELLDNLLSFFKFTKINDKPLTKGEFREKMSERNRDRFQIRLRLTEIEAKLNEKE